VKTGWRARTTRPSTTSATWLVFFLVVVVQSIRDRAVSPAADLILGCAVAAAVIDLAWSWRAVGRAVVEVVSNPTDGTAGEPAPCEVRVVRLRGEAGLTMTTAVNRPSVLVRPGETGFLDAVGPRCRALGAGYELVATGPFGLAGVRRHFAMEPLVQPLALAPKPEPWPEALARIRRVRPRSIGDGVRGVRPYVPGDRPSAVHWPSSARNGELLVRETEAEQIEVVLAVELVAPAKRGESTASSAMWLVHALLAAGDRVVLVTRCDRRAVRAAITDPLAAGRQLAAAEYGPLWSEQPPDDLTLLLR
jgi:uncharacterized protein (DUF58 family)